MRHADRHFLHPSRGAGLDHGVDGGDGDLAALQAEALRGDIALLAEHLEALGLGQLLQDLTLGGAVECGEPRGAFHAALDPGLLVGILDVHELHRDRAAVGLAQDGDDLTQRGAFATEHVVDENAAIPVGGGEAVAGRIELGVWLRHLQTERVELCLQMAAHAVGSDEHQRAQAGDDFGAGARRRDGGRGGLGVEGGGLGLGRGKRVRGPGGAGCILQHRAGFVVQRTEQFGEAGIDRGGVGRPTRILLTEECRVRAGEGGSENVNAGHSLRSFSCAPAMATAASPPRDVPAVRAQSLAGCRPVSQAPRARSRGFWRVGRLARRIDIGRNSA